MKQQLAQVTAELQRQEGHLDELRALEQQMRAQAGQSDWGREAVLTMVHDLETEQGELQRCVSSFRPPEVLVIGSE